MFYNIVQPISVARQHEKDLVLFGKMNNNSYIRAHKLIRAVENCF